MFKKLSISLVLTLSICSAVFAQDNNGLTRQQFKALKLLNVPVIGAGWMPNGFILNKVKVELITKESPAGISNYKLIYEGDHAKSFSIEIQNGGIGDVPGKPTLKLKTVFGQVDVFTHENKCVSTGWINYNNRDYMFYGCDSEAFSRNLDESSISKADALKIIKNLKVIN